ncbi:MAG: acetoin utilization protein AcuC [Pseudomonadota bacterium]
MQFKPNLVSKTAVYIDEPLGNYGFGPSHPFSNDRLPAFCKAFYAKKLDCQVRLRKAVMATIEQVARFHSMAYIEKIKAQSAIGEGFLDYGDTPAFKGVFEASLYVVGSALDALEQIIRGHFQQAFLPIGGLHHAYPHRASGFCVFNDCSIVIKSLRQEYGVKKVAYIDIDVHHGDGVFYAFEDDPDLIFADIHQAGIFPGSGEPFERGTGAAAGHKINITMPAGATDAMFFEVWQQVESLLEAEKPEFILMQAGADCLKGDPLASLCYTENMHGHVTARLKHYANKYAQGRLMAFGGGGYNLQNISKAWIAVVENLLN